MLKENSVSRVQEFTRIAHEGAVETTISGVVRPKIVHFQEVADLVWASGGTDEEVVAAWLHNVVEDTSTSLVDIEENFSKEVADIVHGLTDLDHFTELSLLERKRRQAEHVRTESESVRRIKLADQISNVRSLSIDPSGNLTFEECGQYTKGARLIANECKGISPLLDRLFDEVYEKGLKRFLLTQ